MATGRQPTSAVTINLEDSPGGTSRSLTAFNVGGIEIENIAETQDTTAMGDTFRKHTPTGLQDVAPITMTLLFDTTGSTGTHAIFLAVDTAQGSDGRELIVNFGDTSTWTQDVRLTNAKRAGTLGSLQMIDVTLLPTGNGAWT